MTDEKNNPPSSSGKGFGGFGDLVSDVSKDIESATRESSNPTTPRFRATAPSTSSTQHTTVQTEAPQVNNLPVSPLPPSGSSGAKWFWGIGMTYGSAGGSLVITAQNDKEVFVDLPYLTIPNAHILEAIIRLSFKKWTGCEFPALWSHLVSGVMEPLNFRRNGATGFSA